MKNIGTKASTEHITKAGCSPTVLTRLNKISRKIDMSSDFEALAGSVLSQFTVHSLLLCESRVEFQRDKCRLLKKNLIRKCETVTCSAHVTNTPARKEKKWPKKRKKFDPNPFRVQSFTQKKTGKTR